MIKIIKTRYIFAAVLLLCTTACSTNNPLPPDVDKNLPWTPISPNYKK